MPGISILHSFEPLSEPHLQRAARATTAMLHDDRYACAELYASPHTRVFFTAYPEYCRLEVPDDRFFIFLEGVVYNRSARQVADDLRSLAGQLVDNPSIGRDRLRQWLLAADGEFIAVICDRHSGDLFVATDALGRLPFYRLDCPGRFYLSREPKFAMIAAEHYRHDPVGLAQFLVCSFNFGTRTMTAGLSRVSPANLLHWSAGERKLTVHTLHVWNFEAAVEPDLTYQSAAPRLVDCFLQATRDRCAALAPKVSSVAISGGLDSRAVLAAFEHEHLPYTTHCNLVADRSNEYDFNLAQQLAAVVGCPFAPYYLPETTLADYRDLAGQTEGSTSIIMAMSLNQFRLLRRDHGTQLCLYTGDGGGNVMYPLTPVHPLHSIDDILDATLGTLAFTPLDLVTRLLRLERGALDEAVRADFAAFPEIDPSYKYAHYKIFGRPWRFIMEGEDRVRYHFWLGAPFWNPEILRLMMRLPDRQKTNYRLYREFLRQMHPEVLKVPYANIKSRIDSPWIGLYDFVRRTVLARPWLYHRVRAWRDPGAYAASFPPLLQSELARIISSSQLLPEIFDVAELQRAVAGKLSTTSFHLLATLVMRARLIESEFNRSRFEGS